MKYRVEVNDSSFPLASFPFLFSFSFAFPSGRLKSITSHCEQKLKQKLANSYSMKVLVSGMSGRNGGRRKM